MIRRLSLSSVETFMQSFLAILFHFFLLIFRTKAKMVERFPAFLLRAALIITKSFRIKFGSLPQANYFRI